MVTDQDKRFVVKYQVWEKRDKAFKKPDEIHQEDHVGERDTHKAFVSEPSEIDAVNALLYSHRGTKSKYEIAYIDEIRCVDE